jgi:nitroreductase
MLRAIVVYRPAPPDPTTRDGTAPQMNEPHSTLGLDAEQVRAVLIAAGQAPSLHNSQPWRFRLRPRSIELHADLDRQLPAADPDGRELRLACGAALFSLRLALHGLGIRPIVTTFPDPAQPALLAAVRHGGHKPPTPDQLRLLRAIPTRRTNRRHFADVALTPAEQHALRRAALEEGSWLQLVEDAAQRRTLQQLATRAHNQQLADPDFVAELARWTGTTPDRRDGVPAYAGGPQPAPQDQWTLRDFAAGAGPERIPGKNFEHQPSIAVLTPYLAGPEADIHTGQALQRVLLTATTHGLAVSFLSQILEVASTREELRRLVGAARAPLAVLRIGRGYPVPATPRRDVADLVMSDATAVQN